MLALAYVILVPYSALQTKNTVPNTLPRCQMPELILTVKARLHSCVLMFVTCVRGKALLHTS